MNVVQLVEALELATINLAKAVGKDVRELRLKIEELEAKVKQLESEND